MTRIYPSLDTAGFLEDPAAIAERLLADYWATNISGTNIFSGKLKSLIAAVKDYGGDSNRLAARVQAELEELYSSYLDGVNIEVSIVPMKDDNDHQMDLQMDIRYSTSEGVQYLAKSLKYSSEGVGRIMQFEDRL